MFHLKSNSQYSQVEDGLCSGVNYNVACGNKGSFCRSIFKVQILHCSELVYILGDDYLPKVYLVSFGQRTAGYQWATPMILGCHLMYSVCKSNVKRLKSSLSFEIQVFYSCSQKE